MEDVTEQIKVDNQIKKRLDVVVKELDFISKLDKQFISFQDLSLDRVLQQCVEIAQTLYINTIKSLVSTVEAGDSYTRGHSERVTKFSLDIANALDLSTEERNLLAYCGRLHDIGKIAVADSILKKPGPLTVAERAEIQLHPVKAVEMLSNLKFLEKGLPAIRHHHERYDGRGYPDGLKGEDIPILARIIACADSFDAMTSDRAYRPKLDLADATTELKVNKKKQFDPKIAGVFIDILNAKYR